MKKVYQLILITFLFTMLACSSKQSLQEYYVASSQNPNIIIVDVPINVLHFENVKLSEEEQVAVESLRKLNILAFKKNATNGAEFKTEKTNIKEILRNDKFIDLMKFNTPYGKATIKYLGDENSINEVIVYGDSNDKGFVIIRILGKNIKPDNIVQLVYAIKKSNYKGVGLDRLQEFFKG